MNNFNGTFNNGSQRNFTNAYFNPAQGASAPTNNIVWVQGIEGAKAWQLAPNSMVILLDSEADGKMYIKVSDNIGMSSLRCFNYVEEVQTAQDGNKSLDLSQYVKKDELQNLIKEIITNEQSVSTAQSTTDSKPKFIQNATK